MGFWDFLLGDPDYLDIGRKERVAGTPRAAGRNSNKSVDIWGQATRGAREVERRWNNRGQDYRGSGRISKNSTRHPGFTGRNRRETPGAGIEDILAQLQALQDPSRYLGDGDFTDEAMAAASAQYNPIIAALEQQMASASSRANRNKTELGNMFSALSSNLQADIPVIQQQFAGDKAQTQDQYAKLQKSIQDQYAETQADQQKLMQELNIEAAAADTLPEQQRDRDFFSNLAAAEGQTMQSALGQEERGAVEYTRQGSQIARTEGTTRQADLMADLEQLLQQYEGQIGAQQAAKQNAYSSLLGQFQSEAQESAMDRAQRDFQNYISMIQLGRDLRKDAQGNPVTSVKSPADAAARALGMGLQEGDAQDVQNVFMSALSSDPQILAGIDPMFGGKLSKEALAKRITEAGRNRGLSREELNALQIIALEYFGR